LREGTIEQGYLVLADLSGYTTFVASSEVDHAQQILVNVFALLRRLLTPTLQLAEIEGDALFLFAPDRRVGRGETVLELIESTYVGFRDRLQAMRRAITCPCQACQAVPSLDLKFVTHYGDYVLQDLTGAAKPFGSCVNLAHRLLKNRIAEATGWPAYALFTESALQRMGVRPEGLHTQLESYPHLGETPVAALDLHRRYRELTANRVAYLTPEDAHFTLRRRFPAPLPLLWELLNDPHQRNVWQIGSAWAAKQRPAGRTAAGAHNHCANSDFIEEVLDWRPFNYYTVRIGRGFFKLLVTGELHPDGEATELRWSMAMEGSAPRALRAATCRFIARRLLRTPETFERLDRLVQANAGASVHAAHDE
jgi:hypothetical protein